MTEVLNWGILGAAKFAREHMAPAIHRASGARLAALATSSPDKAAPFLAMQPDLRLHDSYDALLADPGIDVVYIPLPNHLHVEWTEKALAAGKHVLCEKPIALEAAQIDRLIAARDAAGRLVAEAYMIVHHPQWQLTKRLLAEGAIGTLAHVEGIFCFNNAADTGNIRNRRDTGGGGILDIGVYTYGSTRWATGADPQKITHADVTFENGIDVLARVSARFDGFTAHWMNSMRLNNQQLMVFLGDKGTIRLTTPFNANVFGEAQVELHTGTTVHTERFPGVDQYVLQVESFGRSVRDASPYPWTLEDARGTQAMIDAVFAKARG